MIKLSHKQLKEYAQSLGAFYLTGNIYAYENDIHKIQSFEKAINSDIYDMEQVNNVLDFILANHPTARGAYFEQIAYSCGIYGNTGQLHKFTIYDKDYNHLGTIFTYC